ncbi:putative transcription regulator mTERF family [Dioscorea sansibarensis]
MLSKSLASPLLTLESAPSCSFLFSDLSSSTPKLPLVKKNSALCTVEYSWANCRRQGSLNSFHASKRWKLLSIDQAQLVVMEDEEKKTWEDCKEIISTFGFTMEEANLILKKAFGFVHSPYWGEERSKELPKVQSLNAVLDYLKSLGLSDDDLHKILKKFPEVLGCDFDREVKNNVSTLGSEWGIKGKPLRNLLLRNPKVLGYNVDCKGDCMAKCTRCWVRF